MTVAMSPRGIRDRLERLESAAPDRADDPAVIRATLDNDDPAAMRAALMALPPSDLRDELLSEMDEDGAWIPFDRPPDWAPPEPDDEP